MTLKERIESIFDENIKYLEIDNINQEWYLNKHDKYAFVRVVKIRECFNDNKSTTMISYRNINNIQAIDDTKQFTISSHDTEKAIDCTEYCHNSKMATDSHFKKNFRALENNDEKQIAKKLEQRYCDIIDNYKKKLKNFEESLKIIVEKGNRSQLEFFINKSSEKKLNT